MFRRTSYKKRMPAPTLLLAWAALTLVIALQAGTLHAQEATAADWPSIALTSPVTGFDKPVHISHAADGSGRIFVVEQEGRIRIVRNGALLAQPFLDITDRVSCCGERGLLSVAFPLGYATKGHFYVYYTDTAGNTVVARFRVTSDPDRADAASEQVVLAVEQPARNHNGGQLAFGPRDDLLYIGLGDGGGSGDPLEKAQDPTSLLGKLLRIDVESGDPPTYTVPVSNPYTQTPGYRDEIWALGLRNPWRFAFDPPTGDLYIGDVGQNRYEEINYQPASSTGGENYGWDIMEGSHCFEPEDGCDTSGLVLPVAEYAHNGDCSVTGGLVHRDPDYLELDGIYFYADYCSGWIWALQRVNANWESRLLLESSFTITSFGADQNGGLWLTRYADAPDGAIYRLVGVERAYLPLILR